MLSVIGSDRILEPFVDGLRITAFPLVREASETTLVGVRIQVVDGRINMELPLIDGSAATLFKLSPTRFLPKKLV